MNRSASRHLATLLCLFAGSLSACRSALPADTLATLTAPNRTEYERVGGELLELVPRVQATLGVWCAPVPHVVLLRGELPGMVGAECIRGEQIRVGRAVREDPQEERSTLAHELVHWFASGPWASLPTGVEEGLAQLVADELVPERAHAERTSRAILLQLAARGDLGPIDVDRALLDGPHGWEDSPPLMAGLAGALGHALVLRVGRERLRALCERARAEGRSVLDLERLYAAAGVQRGSRWWVPDPTVDVGSKPEAAARLELIWLDSSGTEVSTGPAEGPDPGKVPEGAVRWEARVVERPGDQEL